MDNIGNRLRYLRDLKGLKQKEVAKFVGIRPNTYSDYENNKTAPSAHVLIELCKVLDTSADFILGINHYNSNVFDLYYILQTQDSIKFKNKILNHSSKDSLIKIIELFLIETGGDKRE